MSCPLEYLPKTLFFRAIPQVVIWLLPYYNTWKLLRRSFLGQVRVQDFFTHAKHAKLLDVAEVMVLPKANRKMLMIATKIGGVMLWSPWVYITADAGKEFTHLPNADGDVLIGPLLQWGADAYLPKGDMTDEVKAFVDPLHHPFRTQAPVFIHGGSGEDFYDLIKFFATEMSEVEGNRVKFHTSELAPHGIFAMHEPLGLTV